MKYCATMSTLVVLIISCLSIPVSVMGQKVVFEENFDGLKLGPSQEEGVKKNNVWTKEGPKGWAIETEFKPKKGAAKLPDGLGITEWMGWSFADHAWWTQTAGNQGRGNWKKAKKTVAIADPDEWDDEKKDDKSPDDLVSFNSWLSTPPIDISAISPKSIKLSFDSSFRMEKPQQFEVSAKFDNSAPIQICHIIPDETKDSIAKVTYKITGKKEDKATSEANVDFPFTIEIPNPGGAKKMILIWAVLNADNDWWWAIDNIKVTGVGGANVAVDAKGKLATSWSSIKSQTPR